jgi:hypothetical protein
MHTVLVTLCAFAPWAVRNHLGPSSLAIGGFAGYQFISSSKKSCASSSDRQNLKTLALSKNT